MRRDAALTAMVLATGVGVAAGQSAVDGIHRWCEQDLARSRAEGRPPSLETILRLELGWEDACGYPQFHIDNAAMRACEILIAVDPYSDAVQEFFRVAHDVEAERVWRRYSMPLVPSFAGAVLPDLPHDITLEIRREAAELSDALILVRTGKLDMDPETLAGLEAREADIRAMHQANQEAITSPEYQAMMALWSELWRAWYASVGRRVAEVRELEARLAFPWKPWRWMPGELSELTPEEFEAVIGGAQ